MGTDLTSSLAERWEALQQLESVLGQTDTNMFFTYNGVVYRSVSVNGDGTIQVINQATGQISTLDPVNVYTAFRAASGNPLPPVQPNSQPVFGLKPSPITNILGQIGTYSSLVNMAAQAKWVGPLLQKIPQFAHILGGITVFLSADQIFQGIQNMYKNGFSTSGLLNLGGSVAGAATGFNTLIGATGWSTLMNPAGWLFAGAVITGSISFFSAESAYNNPSVKNILTTIGTAVATAVLIDGALAFAGGPFLALVAAFPLIGPIIAAAIIAFAVLWAIFHPPPPELVAAQNLSQALSPVIWTPGPLAVVAVGTIALLMGWAKNRPPPVMANLTVPAYYLNQVLASNGMSSVDLKSKTPTVLVEPGTGNVVIVSPNGTDSHGNQLVSLQSYEMAKNLQFVSSPETPPEGAYIPFFRMVNGRLDTHPNPDLIKALNTEDKMLMAALSGTLLTHDALNALMVAAAANKYGVGLSQ